jgi:tetratricopeptide (TPR) repeat protein
MVSLLKKFPISQIVLDRVVGELLVRLWLYGARRSSSLSEALYALIPQELRDAFVLVSPGQDPIVAPICNVEENQAWRYFVERATNFRRAHGVVAMTVGLEQPEALAVPFQFKPNMPSGTKVQDATGHVLATWSRQITKLEKQWDEDLGIELQVDVPEYVRPRGSSLALPIVIAKAMRVGRLPQAQALEFIATGQFSNGCLRQINRKQAKSDLAAKMGAVFVAPGKAKSVEQIGIPYDMPINNVIEFLNEEFAKRGFGVMTLQQINEAIRNLQKEIREGRTSLSAAARFLRRYSKRLDESVSKTHAGAILRTQVMRGEIANHTGHPDEALSASSFAQMRALEARDHCAYVEAAANQVVALTDLGCLVEGEAVGRELLRWVKKEMVGDEREQLRSEMVAAGVLGGQVLLQLALRGAPYDSEALELLSRALEIAQELEVAAEIARDSAQIALWHALLRPEQSEAAYAEANIRMSRHDRAETRVSRAYLQNARFLGGYRRLLTAGKITTGFETWELPDSGVGHDSWLNATALKYRGTLYAAAGSERRAEKDFMESVKKLSASTSPLLNFIGATAALQAAESFGVKPQKGARMLKFARRALQASQKSQSHDVVKPWIQRSLGLSNGALESVQPHPQLIFRY